ncbi:GNAT family N-acetyltransferase [Streptomyces venezuelae]
MEQLYLDPAWRGRHLGGRFMSLAKEQRPEGLSLWTFQVNEPAHRFYERHGFIARCPELDTAAGHVRDFGEILSDRRGTGSLPGSTQSTPASYPASPASHSTCSGTSTP